MKLLRCQACNTPITTSQWNHHAGKDTAGLSSVVWRCGCDLTEPRLEVREGERGEDE